MSLLRFRAWDKKYKMLMWVNQIDFLKGTAWLEADQGDHETRHTLTRCFDDVIFMQSTGLIDRNGVEIFDGDVVQAEQYLTTTIPVRINGIVKYSNRYTMFYLDNGSERHDLYMQSLGGSIYNFEIIGNIYTNPELLEGR